MNLMTLLKTALLASVLGIAVAQGSAYACGYEYWGSDVSYQRCDDGSYIGNSRGWGDSNDW